ncbi:MAG: DNA-directed RNA polymerase subunit L [Candidatus Syntropharchaeia archaeon]
MEVNILEHTENELRMEIKGEDHTLLNVLKSELLEDEDVAVAMYHIKFPGMSHPVLYIRTKNGKPMDALKKALSRLISQCEEFKEKFSQKAEAYA